jgi:hypothetical protein
MASIAFDNRGRYRVKMGGFTRTYEVGRRTREEVLSDVRALLPEGQKLRVLKRIDPVKRRVGLLGIVDAKGRWY